MNFETVERRGYIRVVKNGVESVLSAAQLDTGSWAIFMPAIANTRKTKIEALAFIAEQMGDWYTVGEAADRLVELGVFDTPPATQMVSRWARDGRFPGAMKARGLRGRGGPWRIPEAGLAAFAAERRGQ